MLWQLHTFFGCCQCIVVIAGVVAIIFADADAVGVATAVTTIIVVTHCAKGFATTSSTAIAVVHAIHTANAFCHCNIAAAIVVSVVFAPPFIVATRFCLFCFFF